MATLLARRRLAAYGLACALALVLAAPAGAAGPSTRPFCGPVLAGFAHCNAEAVKRPKLTAHIAGNGAPPYGPADLQDAYQLADKAATFGGNQTVAIVDAYDDPHAEDDLAAYRSHYGLPDCTTDNGCFRKVNQSGGPVLPSPNTGWAGEIALDLDMISAVCPHCNILLVETNSNSMSSLLTGVNTAATLGATQISNSWGGAEFSSESSYEHLLDQGVPITVSSGDDGYGVEYPAASAYVTAVGGTSLWRASNTRGWSESAWSGAGSGCSAYIAKPVWQHDTGCAGRTVADVSAVANPDTGVAVYNTYGGGGPWWQMGGTSAAAPIVAASYALLGSTVTGPSFPYDNPTWSNDVSSGSNGSCSITYLCTGLVGLDGPTGIGTPDLAGTGDGSTAVTDRTTSTTTTTTPPATPPVIPVQTPPVASRLSSVSVASTAVRASRGGRVAVRIACGSGPACSGVLSLQVRLHGVSLRTLGKLRYSVGSGKRITVTVRLSRLGLRLLRQKHTLRVYGTALDGDGTTAQASFVLREPRQRR